MHRKQVEGDREITLRTTPRYGGSTFSFMWNETALSAMRKQQRLGLDTFDVIMVPGHCWHEELSPQQRLEFAGMLRQEGLRIDSLNLPALDLNLASCLPQVRAYAVSLYTQVLRMSAELGGRGIVVVPGRISALFPPPSPDSEAWLTDGIEQLLKVAEREDQQIFLELHPQTPLPTSEKMHRFLKGVPHPRLLVAYDVSNAEFVSENQVESIRMLGSRIGQVHLSDGTRTSWRHDRIGLGTVGFAAILQALADIGYQDTNILEIISHDPLKDIVLSLESLAAYSRA